jgi:hypothetical protein
MNLHITGEKKTGLREPKLAVGLCDMLGDGWTTEWTTKITANGGESCQRALSERRIPLNVLRRTSMDLGYLCS